MIISMLIILIAALAVVVAGFIMDRLEMRKLKSGMRTLNKRIKALENPKLETIAYTEAKYDTQMDTAAETTDGGDIPAQTDGEVQGSGD